MLINFNIRIHDSLFAYINSAVYSSLKIIKDNLIIYIIYSISILNDNQSYLIL